jgi:hypothetical protein
VLALARFALDKANDAAAAVLIVPVINDRRESLFFNRVSRKL